MKLCKSETFHLRESYQMHLRYFGLDFRTTIGLKSERTTSDWHDRRYSYSLFAIRGMLSTLLRSGDDPVGGGTGAFRLGFGRTPVRDVSGLRHECEPFLRRDWVAWRGSSPSQ